MPRSDERHVRLCTDDGYKGPSIHAAQVGYCAQQLDFCVYIAQTSAYFGGQSDAGHPADVDAYRCVTDFSGAPELLAIGSIFVFSFKKPANRSSLTDKRYYICLALAILIGSCSGLYDKYLMRQYDHNAVQVYYTLYQAIMMLITWAIMNRKLKITNYELRINHIGVIVLISIFLIISDNVYMLALRDPNSLIAVVSTIRRGGAVIGFAYGLLFLKEPDPWRKVLCMSGIMAGLFCLAIGSI